MAINTPERRRAAIDFGKIRGTGMPLPLGSIPEASRAHVLNLYSGILPTPVPFFFWRNKNRITTNWTGRNTPQDGSTQTI